ncbi:MAG: glycosyltransferase family 2 protein [Ferruginibacter sp.]|nr:glycosyltransferase family 2 protein [Ferruginibacter sp.]
MEKYTIVIPAKNNVATLKHTINTCLRQEYLNFEILISDNCSNDGTYEMIQRLADHRIRYITTPYPMSMTQNFEFALSHATEGFIMCIGADDGLMPDAINYVDSIVEKYGVKAVSCQYAHYFWPNVPVSEHGKLTLNGVGVYRSGVEIRNSSEWLQKTLAFKTALYVCDLPNLYYGFVHRSVIDQCMNNNVYFRSITPDAYAAFATAVTIDKYAYSLRPFCIAGISGKSNGLSQMLNGDIAKDFISNSTHPIHNDFVFSPAFEVIMGEAFYQLKDAFPEKCAKFQIDLSDMLRHAVRNAGGKTLDDVNAAAKKMAALHGINFQQVKDSRLDKLRRFGNRTLKLFRAVLTNGNWYIGMKDSAIFSIKNIEDAATVLAVFASANEGNKFETVKQRFWNMVKNRVTGTK